jgi:hypothetical protein
VGRARRVRRKVQEEREGKAGR